MPQLHFHITEVCTTSSSSLLTTHGHQMQQSYKMNTDKITGKKGTWVANTSSSPIAKRARKAYRLLKQKAAKQNTAPVSVANDRSCIKNS